MYVLVQTQDSLNSQVQINNMYITSLGHMLVRRMHCIKYHRIFIMYLNEYNSSWQHYCNKISLLYSGKS